MRTNRYAGSCGSCHKKVEASAGILIGPPWKTLCKGCANISVDATPSYLIKLTLEGNDVVIQATGWLGAKFQDFRSATMGSAFDSVRKVNRTSVEKIPMLIENLKFSGFTMDIAPEVISAIKTKTEQIKVEVEQADRRADDTQAFLEKNGQGLFPFQRYGVAWLAPRSRALLADEMGCGKTLQSLVALPKDAPVLVVCPAVAKGVWDREAKKWRKDLRVTILSGRGSFRWPEPGEIVVINYDILSDFDKMTAPPGLVVIGDEAHVIKSSKTIKGKRFRMLSRLAEKANGKVWLLTATPLLNRPQELWSILSAANLAKDAFGTWGNFVSIFKGSQDKWGGYTWGTPNPDEVGPLLRKVSLRRLRSDVLPELPAKMWEEITIDLDQTTQKLCDKVLNALRKSKGNLSEEDLLGDLSSLRSHECPAFEEIAKARAALAKSKIPTMLEIVEDYEEQEEPLVVFSAHRAPIDIFHGRDGWAVITGDTAPEDRTKIEDAFQRGELKGVACTIKAGGIAITLTRAAHSLFVDREWTPALNSQAEDRLARIGQTRGVLVKTIVAKHPLDARIYELLTQKTRYITNSVDASRVISIETTEPPANQIDFEEINRLSQKAAEESTRLEKQLKDISDKLSKQEEEKKIARIESRKVCENLMEPNRRHAKSMVEKWAENALYTLAANDPDKAQQKNQVGFNSADGGIGHVLANQIYMGLTETQWARAVKLCQKYSRQVGQAPKD